MRLARLSRAIKFTNARGSDVTGRVHCHDICRLLIHNVTYKARTPSTLTRQTQRPPGLSSMTTVFHNTSKPKDDSSRPLLWLSGEACLNGSHCQSICHPLFCFGFWPKTKDDELMGLNILLMSARTAYINKNVKMLICEDSILYLDVHFHSCDSCKTAISAIHEYEDRITPLLSSYSCF